VTAGEGTTMRRVRRRPPWGLVAAVVLLAAGTGVVSAVESPAQRRGGPQAVEVVGATAVCPEVKQQAGLYDTRVSVGSAPLPAGRQETDGHIVGMQLRDTTKTTSIPITDPGQVAVGLGASVADDGVVVTATGALATGLEAEQVARVNDGRFRGLANLRCEPPKRDAWFVGTNTGLTDASMLVLANVDDSPATVDVTAFGLTGRVDPRPGQGITVAPHSRSAIPLDTLVPNQFGIVVNVRSRQGRVVAALRDARYASSTPLGFDYVPQALPPASQVVVPGLPQGPGVRELTVGNPTGDDTTVSLQVTLRDGQFVPSGLDALAVPAGKSILVDLTRFTNSSPLAVRLTSSGAPVVAGVVLVDEQLFQLGRIRELAFGGSTLPLSGPALLTDLVINRPTESTLVLSAPDEEAGVMLTPITVLGAGGVPPAPRTVKVPAGRTVTVALSTFFPPGTTARLALEVRPLDGSGPVYASRYLRERGGRGTLSTLLDLQGPQQLVSRPATVLDDEAAYP